MDQVELLAKVKDGLGVSGEYLDKTLTPKVLGVKAYMLNAGISEEIMESDEGIMTLTIGVSDLWNVQSSSAQYSPAFNSLLIQLQAQSLPEEEV